MNLPQSTPNDRLHIALLGRRNSGKSTLINALTGQDVALVSPTPGTTTDPVSKAMEIPGIGPCLFIDTPGFDDEGALGTLRIERTLNTLPHTDIALLLCPADATQPALSAEELSWIQRLEEKHIPLILLLTKTDLFDQPTTAAIAHDIEKQCHTRPIPISAHRQQGIDAIRQALLQQLSTEADEPTITGNQLGPGDLVLLVMPQDSQAPKGRLILPQAQTLRELLDKRCLTIACTPDQLPQALKALSRPPKLIITDSQAFKTVYAQKPPQSALTSFSILFAQYKGDIDYYKASAAAIDTLTPTARVLIAEACTHAPQAEDIGRVKIPQLLRHKIGETLQIDIVSGADFPQTLAPYQLIIHCGGCMFNRKHLLSRIEQARQQGVPMTNYGIAIAHLIGILDKITFNPQQI